MFEDRNMPNSFQITKNDKQNSNNKLKSYFQNSSFLVQQQQLSTFIKNLPIIRIDDIKSINKLIQLLIKQNQMIGTKCQQNFLTIKELYGKHDEIIKNNRALQNQINQIGKEKQAGNIYHKRIQALQDDVRKVRQFARQKQEKSNKLSSQNQELNSKIVYYNESLKAISDLFKDISERNFKKSIQKIKQNNRKNQSSKLPWIDWQSLEQYLKQQKKRAKYFPKVKETVELFCHRFFKICQLAPGQIQREDYYKQVCHLVDIIDDILLLKKKNNLISSQSRLASSGGDYYFFENLLDKVAKQKQSNNIRNQDISQELFQLKQQYNSSKKHYEEYLCRMKTQYQESIRQMKTQMQSKQVTLQYYQTQHQKNTRNMLEASSKITEMEQALKAEKNIMKLKDQEFKSLEIQFDSLKNQALLKEVMLKQQWQQNAKTYQYKLAQKIELLQEESRLRKLIKQELQQKMTEWKLKNDQIESQKSILLQENKQLKSQIEIVKLTMQSQQRKTFQDKSIIQKQLIQKVRQCQQLTRRVEKQMIQIKVLQQQLGQGQRQKDLQASYIKQLQSKITDLLNKIKALDNKKTQEKTVKKQLNLMKQTVLQQKKLSKQAQEGFSSQKEQNIRLKGMIKQMKKQLEEVYLQFNSLKSIQQDREKLIHQIQKSDRVKEQLYKQYQLMKIQLIKIQQENKSLSIEVKHYKNALLRIEALR